MVSSHAITRRLEFDAGHRVYGHEGKCNHLHGHRYVAEITVQSRTLDGIGRVVDFGVVKKKVGTWIDREWDHNVLLNVGDPLMQDREFWAKNGRFPFVLAENPTAEVMAAYLFGVAQSLLPELIVSKVRIYETPNCWADYPTNS
mgnify:CR=1 FL=1